MNISALSGFQRDVLVATAALDNPNGRDVASEIGDWYGGERVPDGRIYPALDRLEELGLIRVDRSVHPNHGNTYELTNHGVALLEDIAEAYLPVLDLQRTRRVVR